jgi:3D (Asp-Asp-Asp) domain-containing protein
MDPNFKSPAWGKGLVIILIGMGVLIIALPVLAPRNQEAEADSMAENSQFLAQSRLDGLIIIEENSLLPMAGPSSPEPAIVRKIEVVITGYSSTPWETDGDPHITAAGTLVRDGVIASNYLSFGTKVRIPELFGDKIFVVEDRMNWTKGKYQIDIWFPSYEEALNFGVKRTYIEILES